MVHRQMIDEFGRVMRSGNVAIDDPTDKLHDRIRKVLALTKSGNEQEAQLAATKLQSLLQEHNLSMADLEQRGQASPGVREEGHDLGKAAFKWKLDLADGIAEFYYCVPLVDRTRKTVAFIGRPDNVESLQMLYGWVIDQIKDIAREERRVHYDRTQEHIDPLRWQVAFGEGAVERLIDRLHEMKARQAEDMSRDEFGNVTALAVHHAAEASDYLEEKYGYRVDGKRTQREIQREKEYEERVAKAQARMDDLRTKCEESGDMEPFYSEYPWERPESEEDKKAREVREAKESAEWIKKERRNARRRTGGWGGGREKSVDYEKEGQSDRARSAGRESAGRINLQPFVESGQAGKVKGELK